MPITEQEHLTTNFGFDVPVVHEEPNVHRVIPAHVDEHAREEMLEGLHPDHATNFGLILATEIADDAN